MNNWDIRSF